jgi:hypothetical protein
MNVLELNRVKENVIQKEKSVGRKAKEATWPQGHMKHPATPSDGKRCKGHLATNCRCLSQTAASDIVYLSLHGDEVCTALDTKLII